MAIFRLGRNFLRGLLFLALHPAAFAETKSYCKALPELTSGVKDCQQNVYFAKSAQLCLDKMEKQIQSEQAFLNALMLLNNTATASSQSARIRNNSTNLTGLRATMEKLMADARTVRQEIVEYSKYFVYAGPISQAKAQQLNLEGYLQKFKCFSRNREALAQVVKIVDERIAEFDKVTKAAAGLEAQDSAHLEQLNASTVNVTAKGHAPASSPVPGPSVKGSSENSSSTITGTERQKPSLESLSP